MARTANLTLKQQLLDQVANYLAHHGLGMLSLRPMAAELNMSTNRLVHHFGTKDQLIAAALERVIHCHEALEAHWDQGHTSVPTERERLMQWWTWMCDSPENLATVRLGLEAATLDATASGLTGSVRADQIGIWRDKIEARLMARGVPRRDAVVEASIFKAIFTGFTVDLVASGHVEQLSAALAQALDEREHQIESLIATAQMSLTKRSAS